DQCEGNPAPGRIWRTETPCQPARPSSPRVSTGAGEGRRVCAPLFAERFPSVARAASFVEPSRWAGSRSGGPFQARPCRLSGSPCDSSGEADPRVDWEMNGTRQSSLSTREVGPLSHRNLIEGRQTLGDAGDILGTSLGAPF